MENTLKKNELIVRLRAYNIDFAPNATVAELRKMYAEQIGSRSSNSKSAENVDQSIPINQSKEKSTEKVNENPEDKKEDCTKKNETEKRNLDRSEHVDVENKKKTDVIDDTQVESDDEQAELDRLLLTIPKSKNRNTIERIGSRRGAIGCQNSFNGKTAGIFGDGKEFICTIDETFVQAEL